MKFSALLLLLLCSLLSSCTINDRGDLELMWVFYVLVLGVLAFVAVMAFSVAEVNDKQKEEAEKRGVSINVIRAEAEQKRLADEFLRGYEVEYLGGYPKYPITCKAKIGATPSKILLYFSTNSMMTIPKEDIRGISSEKSASRSAGKAAAGAIVGGLLSGGVGLIVGGALGARQKDTSELYITYMYNGTELTINLKTGENTDKVYAMITSLFS